MVDSADRDADVQRAMRVTSCPHFALLSTATVPHPFPASTAHFCSKSTPATPLSNVFYIRTDVLPVMRCCPFPVPAHGLLFRTLHPLPSRRCSPYSTFVHFPPSSLRSSLIPKRTPGAPGRVELATCASMFVAEKHELGHAL